MADRDDQETRVPLSLPAITGLPHGHGSGSLTMEKSRDYTGQTEGFDYEFIPPPDPKYECPICLLILREPCQTKCGHRFCRDCITRWINEHEHKRCPSDNEPITVDELFADNFAKREILSLSVRCPNSKNGCTTLSVLARLEEHESQCPMAYQPCPLGCANILFRKDIKEHVVRACDRRNIECSRCRQKVLAAHLQIHLKDSCPNIDVSCQLCNMAFLREKLQGHMDTDCPNVLVKCVFNVWGCKVELKRCDRSIHQQEAMVNHLSLLSAAFCQYCLLQGIHPQALAVSDAEQNPSREASLNTEILASMSNLSQLMQVHRISEQTQGSQSGTVSESASASSLAPGVTNRGYTSETLSPSNPSQQSQAVARNASAAATTTTSGQNTTVIEDVFTFTSGEDTFAQDKMGNRSVLPREFASLKDRNAYQDESLARHDQHITELESKINQLEHLNRDLREKVHNMEDKLSFYSTLESRACNGEFLWKLKYFSRLRREAETGETTVLHSPAFYSSLYGYKLCVRVNLNGVDSARGTHMSVFVHFMQGEFDDVLDWPFNGKIILTILDQNPFCELRRHIVETLSAKPNLAAFQRPSTPRNHKGFGYMEFVPLHILDRSTFVLNDVLIIKAQVIPGSAFSFGKMGQ